MEEENYEEAMINYIRSKIELKGSRVIWIPRMDGETTTLYETWKQLIVKTLKRISYRDPFDYVIEIMAQLPKEAERNSYTNAKEQRMIAEKLGILDEEDGTLRRLLESRDELDYYQYYLDDHNEEDQRDISPELGRKIYYKLKDKKYLLVFEHLKQPIKKTLLTEEMGLPIPSKYNGCWWLISTLSDGICSVSMSDDDLVFDPYLEKEQTKYGIHLLMAEAQDILSTIFLTSGREDKILDCLFYTFMFTPRTQVQNEYGIEEDELVRFWMEEGFITELTDTDTTSILQQQEEDYDYNASHLFDTGKAIINNFIARSLLHRHLFIIPTNAMQIFYSKSHIYNHGYMHKWLFPYNRWDREKERERERVEREREWERKRVEREREMRYTFWNKWKGKWEIDWDKWQMEEWEKELEKEGLDLELEKEVEMELEKEKKRFESEKELEKEGLELEKASEKEKLDLEMEHTMRSMEWNIDWNKSEKEKSEKEKEKEREREHIMKLRLWEEREKREEKEHIMRLREWERELEEREKTEEREWMNKKHISLFQSKWTRFHLGTPRCRELATLILRGCSHMHNIPDDFFQYMPLLRILDLSYTDLTFVPSSVSYLHNLRLLALRGCQKLINLLPCSQPLSSPFSSYTSLPSPEHHHMLNLHVLDVSSTNIASLSTTLHMPNLTDFFLDGCTSLLDPPPFLPSLNKLRLLRITGTQITTFPESTFSCMEWLRVLDLSNNHHLVSLPQSLSKARLLEELHIKDCPSLIKIEAVDGAKLKMFSFSSDNLTSLPEWFSRAKNLEKLHLQNCRAMEKINIAGNASMRSFFLSGSPIVELSLRGCKNLEIVELHELGELEVLDLSFTRISELPANIFNDLPKLRYFRMVAAKNLRRFPWHQIEHLPKEFSFDHCSCHVEELNGQINIRRLDGDNKARAHIFVDDPRFFWSLKEKDCKRLIGRHLLEFHVTISPCERRCNKEEAEASSSCRFIEYKDIYSKRSELMREVEQHRPNGRLCRHLTMEGVDRLPGGAFPLLDRIDSLSISEDRSVVSLSDMSPMNTLKECILTQCHNMESVAVANKELQQKLLEMLWVSGLGKLTTLFSCVEYVFNPAELGSLKHVHIEHCPRLEKLFPNNKGLLPFLETLTIKFCDSVREITYKGDKRDNYESLHPRLHTLILLELPKLLHFREDPEAKLPSLKTLHVRGCWRLRRLPLLLLQGDVVEVSGELKWWNKLTWDHYLLAKSRFSIRFKPQAKFYTWEPSIRGRSRRRNRSSRTTTIIH